MAVTSTNNLRLGSTGDDVLELQKLLNSAGNYNLAEDGSFGEKTLAAVKDYQTNNGLEVDGIVGTNTWGKLTGGSTSSSGTATTTTPTTGTNSNTGFTYEAYQKSDAVAQAEALLQQQLSQKPGAYTSTWSDQLNETIAQILNRDKFSYDLNADALYQQYKDQYMMLGQQASMDAMGQAAALTGGYGNSYAQTVGQQAYQGYLQRLNEVVPELYGMARDQYNQEGQALYDQASLLAGMEDQEYGRYRDSLSDYYTELNRLTEDARYQGEQDYAKWADKLNLDYGMHRDQVADSQWQAEFDEAKRQYDQQYELQNGKSSDGSSNDGNGGGYDNAGLNDTAIKWLQKCVGADHDGKWGPDSQAKAKAKYGITNAYELYKKLNGAQLRDTEDGGVTADFNGTTYSEAVSYLNSQGISNANSSMVMTRSEFSRVKASGTSKNGEHKCANYQEYLEFAVASMLDAYGKK